MEKGISDSYALSAQRKIIGKQKLNRYSFYTACSFLRKGTNIFRISHTPYNNKIFGHYKRVFDTIQNKADLERQPHALMIYFQQNIFSLSICFGANLIRFSVETIESVNDSI